MSIRVNPDRMPDLLSALSTVQKQQNNALLQLATGHRVNTPSDDAAATAQVIGNHDLASRADSFQSSMSTLSSQLQAADSTLSSVVTSLTRALSLGVQAGNSATLNNSDRAAIAAELGGIQNELLNLANLSFAGRYVFSGTEQVQPYVLDNTQPSGVRYDGNAGVNNVTVGNGYQLQANVPGSQLFSDPSADMFQAINDLINAVTTNTGIDTAVQNLRQAFDFVTAQRVIYGNNLNQIEAQQTFLSTQKTQLSSQENTLVGADMAKVASDVVNTENARNAALAAIGRVSQTSLFDFLG